jgi:hypothetical protein
MRSRSLYYIEVIQPMAQGDNLYRFSSGIYVVRNAVPARYSPTRDSVRSMLQQKQTTLEKPERLPQVYWLSGSDVWMSIKNLIEKSW